MDDEDIDEPDPRPASAVIRVTGKDRERFLAARDKPQKPNKALQLAFVASREMFGED